MTLGLVAALAAGYLLGGIPFAEIVARLRGISIFDIGSGNMGAMNTIRHLGVGAGIAVFVGDVAKGSAATLIGLWMASVTGLSPLAGLALPLAAGLGAVVGHAWSPYAGLRGGKALATMFGLSLPLYPIGGAYGLILLVALVLLLRRTTLATIITLGLYPLLVVLSLQRQNIPAEVVFAVFTGVVPLAAIAILKHVIALRRSGETRI